MVIELVGTLADRVIQLLTIRKQARRDLLIEQVSPMFEAFEAVHRAYLESFERYRERIQEPSAPLASLLGELRKDNLFTEHERIRIVQMGDAVDDPQLGPLVAAIRDYLVDARVAAAPIAGYRTAKFRNPQLWRRTLIDELEAIAAERWAIVLDPYSSAPPLYGEDAEAALREVRRTSGIPEDDPRKLDRTKAHLALQALDGIVGEMQEAYGRATAEYERLRQTLSK